MLCVRTRTGGQGAQGARQLPLVDGCMQRFGSTPRWNTISKVYEIAAGWKMAKNTHESTPDDATLSCCSTAALKYCSCQGFNVSERLLTTQQENSVACVLIRLTWMPFFAFQWSSTNGRLDCTPSTTVQPVTL